MHLSTSVGKELQGCSAGESAQPSCRKQGSALGTWHPASHPSSLCSQPELQPIQASRPGAKQQIWAVGDSSGEEGRGHLYSPSTSDKGLETTSQLETVVTKPRRVWLHPAPAAPGKPGHRVLHVDSPCFPTLRAEPRPVSVLQATASVPVLSVRHSTRTAPAGPTLHADSPRPRPRPGRVLPDRPCTGQLGPAQAAQRGGRPRPSQAGLGSPVKPRAAASSPLASGPPPGWPEPPWPVPPAARPARVLASSPPPVHAPVRPSVRPSARAASAQRRLHPLPTARGPPAAATPPPPPRTRPRLARRTPEEQAPSAADWPAAAGAGGYWADSLAGRARVPGSCRQGRASSLLCPAQFQGWARQAGQGGVGQEGRRAGRAQLGSPVPLGPGSSASRFSTHSWSSVE